jgi:hypothetical protein
MDMIKKWIFAAGAGVGYVLGTRAGRQKYDAMVGKARQVMERPDVKEATEAIQTQASRLYDEGRHKLRDKVRDIRTRVDHKQDDDIDASLRLDQSTSYAPGAPPPKLTPLSERR